MRDYKTLVTSITYTPMFSLGITLFDLFWLIAVLHLATLYKYNHTPPHTLTLTHTHMFSRYKDI